MIKLPTNPNFDKTYLICVNEPTCHVIACNLKNIAQILPPVNLKRFFLIFGGDGFLQCNITF